MRILVVGGGGREHAITWALRREHPDATLYVAPGNPGTATLATNLPIGATDRTDRRTCRAVGQRLDYPVRLP